MKIDIVNMPDIQGKSPSEALKTLYEHCRETAVIIMRVNNEVEDLKRKLLALELRVDRQ